MCSSLEPESADIADPHLCHISADPWFRYEHLRGYTGPSNIAHIAQFVQLVGALLAREERMVCVCTAREGGQRSNAVLLVGCYLMFKEGMGWKTAARRLKPLSPYVSRYTTEGRTASEAHGTLGIIQCLKALFRFTELGLLSIGSIDLDEYYRRECPLNGDMTWIIPRQILALAGPTEGTYELHQLADYCREHGVTAVVRLNRTGYCGRQLEQLSGHALKHYDILVPDGGTPTISQVMRFIHLCQAVIQEKRAAIAVHCRAGLGRTGTMIACWLMWSYGVTAVEATAFLRVMRPGSILEDQPLFLHEIQGQMQRREAGDCTRQADFI